ncbi:hypothetical protein Tco_1578495 [Tanacetum coccineum]
MCLSTKEKYTTYITKHYAARYYKEGIEDIISDRWCTDTHCYIFEALNGIHHWEDNIIDFFKAEMSTITEGNAYSDLRIKSVVLVGKIDCNRLNTGSITMETPKKKKFALEWMYCSSTLPVTAAKFKLFKKRADEVIYSLFAKQSEDWDLLHEDLEQIDDVDIEEMDIKAISNDC